MKVVRYGDLNQFENYEVRHYKKLLNSHVLRRDK